MKKLSQAWKEFSVLPKKNKIGAGLLLFFLFILTFFAAVTYQKTKSFRSQPVPGTETQAPASQEKANLAVLSLSPVNQRVKAGKTFTVTINLKTNNNRVDTVDAILLFDSQILSIEEVSKGIFFAEYPIKKIEDGKVILTGTIGSRDKQEGGVKGEGAMGSITFKALKVGKANVSFDNNSLAVVQGKNVLGETSGATYEIY